jgi:hypothetical protein
MRRFLAIPLASLLLAGATVPALAAPNVSNLGGSATIAQGGWDSYDEATGAYASGYVVVIRDASSPETYAEYSEYAERYVQCTGADTPDDSSDDAWGVVATFRYGYGEASLDLSKRSGTATAAGTLHVSEGSVDECAGEKTEGDSGDVAFTLDLTATSGTIRESGRGSFKLPGEFNSHSSYKVTYRLAEGTFTAGADAQAVQGQFGTVAWMDHSNG